jgi:hypothetical protein
LLGDGDNKLELYPPWSCAGFAGWLAVGFTASDADPFTVLLEWLNAGRGTFEGVPLTVVEGLGRLDTGAAGLEDGWTGLKKAFRLAWCFRPPDIV